MHPYAGLHEHLVRILDAAFEQAGELIRVEPPADPPLPDKRCIHVRQAAKEPVPRRNTEYIVNQLEILHIRTNDIILPVRMMQQNLLDPLIKELLAVQPRQSIILNQPNHGGGFPQMDNAGYPMQNNLGFIGLCHKIRRTVGQSGNLFGFAVVLRGHDNGDGGQGTIRFDHGEKGIPVHYGHNNVQQNQGNPFAVLF